MKTIKTNTPITQFNGEEAKGGDGIVLTIGNQTANALATHKSNPARCWQLGKAFSTEKEVDLKAEDVVFVKQALEEAVTNRVLTAMVAGQIIDILEAKEEKKK